MRGDTVILTQLEVIYVKAVSDHNPATIWDKTNISQAGVPLDSMLRPILFGIYINDLSDVISAQIIIYTVYTDISSCFYNSADRNDTIKLSADVENNFQVFNWGKKYYTYFKDSKMILQFLTRSIFTFHEQGWY